MKPFLYALALSLIIPSAAHADAPGEADDLGFDELKLAWEQAGDAVVKWDVELNGEIVATVDEPEYDIFDDLDPGWEHYNIRVRSYNAQGDVSDWSKVLSPWILKPACVGAGQPVRIDAVQRKLQALGYYDGAIDGIVGPHTRNAIKAFQREHGLKATGKLGAPLAKRLREASTAR